MPSAVLILPGRLDTWTGGYGYDRRMVEGLRARGWDVEVHELDDSFPSPTSAACAHAADVLARIPDNQVVLFDGLAFGVLADEAAAHARRLRLVALVHHPLAAEAGISAEQAAHLRDSERRALALVARIVVTSGATAAMLADYGVTADRIAVIEPGTDAAPLARGSAGPDVHLLCVGTLIPRKGHQLLIAALADVPGAWRLTCVGSGDRDPGTFAALRAQTAAAGLAARVTFAGEMDATALALVYDGADVFVLPTLFEGYGMVVAEALARGLPVISTRTGAIAELVGDAAGVLVPAGNIGALKDALARVIGDSRWRAQLSSGARAVRHRLPTWDAAGDAMAAVLTEAGA